MEAFLNLLLVVGEHGLQEGSPLGEICAATLDAQDAPPPSEEVWGWAQDALDTYTEEQQAGNVALTVMMAL